MQLLRPTMQHNTITYLQMKAHYEGAVLGKKMFFFGVPFGAFQNCVCLNFHQANILKMVFINHILNKVVQLFKNKKFKRNIFMRIHI